jgi:hypothetical protein
MKNTATAVVLLLLGFFFCWAADNGQVPEMPIISVMAEARSYVLAKGPTGELRVGKSKHSFKPGVSIYPDGRVIIIKFDATEHKTTISHKTMDALRGAFHESGFLSITPEVLKKRMAAADAATHTRFGVEDGGSWTFSVHRGSSNHTLTVSAPFDFARHYTNVQELRILTNLITLTYVSAGMKKIE